MGKSKSKPLKEYFAIGDISAALVLKNLPFVIFIAFLILTYIANAHYSEKTIREIQAKQKELKELRWHYMSVQSDIMYNTKLSQVAEGFPNSNLNAKDKGGKKILVKNK